jgi:hypothetical protein
MLGTVLLSLLAVVSAVALLVAGIQIARELGRPPTAAERAKATAQELAQRWESWPSERIFPGTLSYTLEGGIPDKAQRIAIDPGITCPSAFDAPAARLADGAGCLAALRADYLDQTQGLVITISVVAFPDEASASRFRGALPTDGSLTPGMHVYAPAGSVAARLTDRARQAASWVAQGPYAVGAVVGYTDGRPAVTGQDRPTGIAELANRMTSAILDPLAKPAQPTCAGKEWRC